MDFETRSSLPLRTHGTWRYSVDLTTEILCLAWRLPSCALGQTALWHPAFPHLGIAEEGREDLTGLFAWIAKGGLVEAHNAFFERCIWLNKFVQFGAPFINSEQWRCSAAKAAAHSLPRGLDDALAALRLPVRKDEDGAKLMKAMVQPRKAVKRDKRDWRRQHCPCRLCDATGRLEKLKRDGTPTKNGEKCWRCDGRGHSRLKPPPMPLLWRESKEEMERLWAYNRQDVLAEEALSEALPDLNDFEQRVYCVDQDVNERGFYVDLDGVEAALSLIDHEQRDLNGELADITKGAITKATQRQKVLAWLEDNGLTLDDTRKETLDELLDAEQDELPPWVLTEDANPKVFRVLEIVRTIGRSSTAKYLAMQNWAADDQRVRGGLLYHGASTGRWTGRGPQIHNLPKAGL